jgi:hypothetical protein
VKLRSGGGGACSPLSTRAIAAASACGSPGVARGDREHRGTGDVGARIGHPAEEAHALLEGELADERLQAGAQDALAEDQRRRRVVQQRDGLDQDVGTLVVVQPAGARALGPCAKNTSTRSSASRISSSYGRDDPTLREMV